VSLAKTPLELFTDNTPPSSTEYSSETPIGSSFPDVHDVGNFYVDLSPGRNKAFSILKKNKIDALIVLGGDGSLTGAKIFYEENNFPIIGIP
jgi:NAD kinase